MNDPNAAAAAAAPPEPNPVPKSARRVVFSETLPKHRRRSFKIYRRILSCCAWICIAVLGMILGGLIVAVILTSFLESGLPEIRVRTVDLSEFAIENSTTNAETAIVDARVEMSIEMWNKNERMEIRYSDVEVNFLSEDVELGRYVVSGFSQMPGNTTFLNLTMNVEDSTDRQNALQLEDDRQKMQMNVQVAMKARIGFHLGMFKLNKVLILVACEFQQKLLVYSVQEPPCNIRMFPIL